MSIINSNQITDGYLVALARQHHMTLATFDEPLALAMKDDPGLVELVQ
jgi:predicted nucleic acid-binding protein